MSLIPFFSHHLFLFRGHEIYARLGPWTKIRAYTIYLSVWSLRFLHVFVAYRWHQSSRRGGYSHVLGGTRASDGSPVALKISTSDGENSETEAEILSQLRHRNIVPLLDQGTAQGQTILVMQYYEGTLHSLIQKGFTGGDAQVKARLREIVSAVQYSHSNGIIHRDIKCSNILIGRDESWNVGDFGISRKGKGSTLFDTATWTMAPELRRDGLKTHNSSVDVWSLGIIAYQLLEGPGQPRGAVHSHTDLVFSSDRWKSNYGTLLKDFVKRAVLQDPTRRCVHVSWAISLFRVGTEPFCVQNFVSRALEPSRPPRGNKKLIICSRPLAWARPV